MRVPMAHFGPIKVPEGPPDDRFLYLSDVLPTAWQAVAYADVPAGGSLAVYGLGPIGQMCVRIARHLGAETVIGVDLVPERLELARRHGAEAIDLREGDPVAAILDRTDGRGADAVVDAVGMEAHGAPVTALLQRSAGVLPDKAAQVLMERAGVDRLSALLDAIRSVRRGGTLSISGVYGGAIDPLPMMELFDRQIQIRMGPGERAALGGRHPPAAPRRRPARDGRPRDAPPAARRRAPGLRALPEEGGRRDQGRPPTVITVR